MVETALVLPLVFLLLLGVLEFGQMLRVQQALANAAREGARAGAIHLDDTRALNTADTVTTDYLTQTGIDLTLVSVSTAFSQVNGVQAIEILIDYDYASGLTGWVPGMSDTLQLHSRVVMRREA